MNLAWQAHPDITSPPGIERSAYTCVSCELPYHGPRWRILAPLAELAGYDDDFDGALYHALREILDGIKL